MAVDLQAWVCLICERVEPPCGWAWDRGGSYYDSVVKAERIGSKCRDCQTRSEMGQD